MKRLTSLERAQLVSKSVNEFKTVFTRPFTSEAMTLQLKSIDCPNAINVFSILKKTGQLKKVSGREYAFVSSEPIYFKSIQKDLDVVVETRKEVQKKFYSKDKKVETPKIESSIITDEEIEIQHAIALLKSNGYKISKPIITFEEI